MFWLILGHGTPRQAISPEGSRPEGTQEIVERRSSASACGPARSHSVAIGRRTEFAQGVAKPRIRGLGRPHHRPAVSRSRIGAGTVRKAAAWPSPTAWIFREATHYRYGVQFSARRAGPLDRSADCPGGRQAETGAASRSGNHSHPAGKPRPEAVAGKKCGAWRSWMTTTSPKW